MADIQGAVQPDPSAATQGGQENASADLSVQLQQFQPESDATSQGAVQGQDGITEEERAKRAEQSLADKRLAENLKLQQQLSEAQRQMAEILLRQQPEAARPRNPYDAQSQPTEWWEYEKQALAEASAAKSSELVMKQLNQLASKQAEISWQQQHPDVDLAAVKAFAQMNGIAEWNLEAAYRLMKYPENLASVARVGAQNALNSQRQPQVGAVSMRGIQSSGGPGEYSLSYEKLAQEYNATNGEAAKSWPPGLYEAFKKETFRREGARRSS